MLKLQNANIHYVWIQPQRNYGGTIGQQLTSLRVSSVNGLLACIISGTHFQILTSFQPGNRVEISLNSADEQRSEKSQDGFQNPINWQVMKSIGPLLSRLLCQ